MWHDPKTVHAKGIFAHGNVGALGGAEDLSLDLSIRPRLTLHPDSNSKPKPRPKPDPNPSPNPNLNPNPKPKPKPKPKANLSLGASVRQALARSRRGGMGSVPPLERRVMDSFKVGGCSGVVVLWQQREQQREQQR